jgi:hypothetical protein
MIINMNANKYFGFSNVKILVNSGLWATILLSVSNENATKIHEEIMLQKASGYITIIKRKLYVWLICCVICFIIIIKNIQK